MENGHYLKPRGRFAATFILSLTLLASASILSNLLPKISSHKDILYVLSNFPWAGIILTIASTGFLLVLLTAVLHLINKKVLILLEADDEENVAEADDDSLSKVLVFSKEEDEVTVSVLPLELKELIHELARILPASIGLKEPVSNKRLFEIKQLTKQIEYLISSNSEPSFSALDYESLGDALFLDGRYEEALNYFDKGKQLEEDVPGIWYSRGITLGRLKRHEDAFDSFNTAIVLKRDYERAWVGRAIALYMMGKYPEALESCSKALEINSRYHAAWNNKGVTLLALEKYDEAIECFNKALSFRPDLPGAIYNKACAYALLGAKSQALDYLEEAIRLEPSFKEVVKTDSDFRELSETEKFKELIQNTELGMDRETSTSPTGYVGHEAVASYY